MSYKIMVHYYADPQLSIQREFEDTVPYGEALDQMASVQKEVEAWADARQGQREDERRGKRIEQVEKELEALRSGKDPYGLSPF